MPPLSAGIPAAGDHDARRRRHTQIETARLVVQAFARPSPAQPAAKEFDKLTDCEQAVLDLLIEGYPYKHIAERIGVSVHTVHFHIRHIYEKLHVHSRAEAVARFMKR